jgi:predicted SprT family Zn-dependent metalloprotease
MAVSLPRTWKECKDQQFIKIYDEVYEEAQNLGLLGKHKKKHPLYIRSSVKTWGQCRWRYEGNDQYDCAISINDKIVIAKSLDAARKVIVHEIAHIAAPGEHHNDVWYAAGNKLGKKWGIKVQRTDDYDGIELKNDDNVKHILECTKCGKQYRYTRNTKPVQNYTRYRCGCCNGTLKKIK